MEGHVYLSSSWLRLIYSRAMAKNLRVMIARHKEELKGDKRVDWEALEGNPYQTLLRLPFFNILTPISTNHRRSQL